MTSVFRLLPVKSVQDKEAEEPTSRKFIDRAWLFSTHDEAVEMIQQLKKKGPEDDSEYYCFYIQEMPLGIAYHKNDMEEYASWEVYDSKGKFIHGSVCSSLPNADGELETFNGRPEDQVAFKRGEFVEVLDIKKGIVTPMLVVDPPVTPQWCKDNGMDALVSDNNGLNFTYDAYTLSQAPNFAENSGTIVQSMLIFPISKEEYSKLKKQYGETLNDIVNQYCPPEEEYDD